MKSLIHLNLLLNKVIDILPSYLIASLLYLMTKFCPSLLRIDKFIEVKTIMVRTYLVNEKSDSFDFKRNKLI